MPVFGAARVIAGPGTAILAATIAALLPAGASYSELANADHHCSVAFFGAVWLWGALLAVTFFHGPGKLSADHLIRRRFASPAAAVPTR
mgnify:CR=1 FL=1